MLIANFDELFRCYLLIMLTPAEAMNGMAARAANTIAAKMRFPVFFICGPILPIGLQKAMTTYTGLPKPE